MRPGHCIVICEAAGIVCVLELSENIMNISKAIILVQLIVCGAIIGLYVVRIPGFVGLELTPHIDAIGTAIGALSVAVLKAAHIV